MGCAVTRVAVSMLVEQGRGGDGFAGGTQLTARDELCRRSGRARELFGVDTDGAPVMLPSPVVLDSRLDDFVGLESTVPQVRHELLYGSVFSSKAEVAVVTIMAVPLRDGKEDRLCFRFENLKVDAPGKTSSARQYFYQKFLEFSHVFWFDVEFGNDCCTHAGRLPATIAERNVVKGSKCRAVVEAN